MNYHNTKHISPSAYLLLLICMVGICVPRVHAQESCYEQYLREHNMPFLTAEDADDSYEELKKEVLARQAMRKESLFQPLLLAVDTISGTCHLLAPDGSLIADVHLALVDSTWYMWLSVDPLADKYPGSTPYLYCNGNPVRFVDYDGRYFNDEMEEFVTKYDQQLAAKAEEYTQLRDNYKVDSYLYNKYDGFLQEINKSRQDLIDMRNDQYFEYYFVKSLENATSCTSRNLAGDPIVLMEFFEEGMQSHEGRHGGQNARREIIYRPNGTCLLYGISSEQDAYRAQLAYFGSITISCLRDDLGDPIPWPTTINSLSEVNRQFVSSITTGGFEYVYPPKFLDLFLWLTH